MGNLLGSAGKGSVKKCAPKGLRGEKLPKLPENAKKCWKMRQSRRNGKVGETAIFGKWPPGGAAHVAHG